MNKKRKLEGVALHCIDPLLTLEELERMAEALKKDPGKPIPDPKFKRVSLPKRDK